MSLSNVSPGEKSLEIFKTMDGYRQHFMDADYWRLYVRRVCQRHAFTPCQEIRAGLAGTCPTFIVEDRWVVKFFGQLFEGGLAFEVERRIGQLLTSDPRIPAPAVIASGRLFEDSTDWPWPYLIFEFIPGISIGEVYEQVSFADKLKVARMMGEITRRFHQLPLTGNGLFQPTWEAYGTLLQTQHARCKAFHQAEQTMPRYLIEQIEDFLLPVEALIDWGRAPHLIHADLTADHLLGRLDKGRWTTLGLIDFGDAMVADLGYELIALHLDLFRCNKHLLGAYLQAYGLDKQALRTLPAKAMSLTLLHRFNVLEGLFGHYSKIDAVSTLDELASLLWDINTPGLDQ